MLFVALATAFGLEAILGAFLAGATLKLLDRDRAMTHTMFHMKLQAVGFCAFVPFFFISKGMSLDVDSLADPRPWRECPSSWLRCWSPALSPQCCTGRWAQRRGQVIPAGLLQVTSLSIPVVAGAVDVDLGAIRPDNYVALVTAGLLSSCCSRCWPHHT